MKDVPQGLKPDVFSIFAARSHNKTEFFISLYNRAT
jgi:hypothetical protein